MRSPDRIEEYVALVCRQLRWKKAHYRVSAEMTDHIVDCRNAYMADGYDEITATEKSIADTGDAEAIGSQLDRIHRPKPQWGMFITTAALLAFGILVSLLFFTDDIIAESLYIRLLYTESALPL